MLAELAVILIILMTVAFTYLKGSIIKAFLLLISTFIAATIAFAYFETLGQLVIGYKLMPQWAFGATLLIIFAFTLAILNAIGGKLIKTDIYFGDASDRIIKCFIAVFAGFAIAGVILTAAAMMPIGSQWPYERFSATPGQAEPQKKLILNADGFITNLVSLISRGSMSGQKSFAVFHPSLLDEIYLNRIGSGENFSTITESAIAVDAAIAPQTPLVSAKDNQPINQSSQTKAVIIRARLDNTVFTMSQVRLICKNSDSAGNFTGSGQVFWPTGYITRDNIVEPQNLSDKRKTLQVDFVFCIPTNTVPVLLQYKQNAAAQVGKLTSGQITALPQTPAQQIPVEQAPAQHSPAKKHTSIDQE
ncbi:MAG: CvpA family protein [Sedimentisphaerales bacterium]